MEPMPPDQPSVDETAGLDGLRVIEVLTKSVRRATGLDSALPRPGQELLSLDITDAYRGRSHHAGEAPTGVGKTLAYLAVAAVAAADLGERSVVTTESLSLQSQIIDKDGPVVADACEEATGYRPKIAVLKGWSNYACTIQAIASAVELAGDPFDGRNPTITEAIGALDDFIADGGPTGDAGRLPGTSSPWTPAGSSTDEDRDPIADAELLRWALAEIGNGGDADRHAYPKPTTNWRWNLASIARGECLGRDRCQFADTCRPTAARDAAAEADIIVTNHAMLAVQAAHDVPVVIGSKSLGHIDHIVVDEAHALANSVREQGSTAVSGASIVRAARALGRVLDGHDPKVAGLISDGEAIATSVDDEIAAAATVETIGEVQRLDLDADPLADSAVLVEQWQRRAGEMLKKVPTRSAKAAVGVARAKDRLASLNSDIALVRTHSHGVARWIEKENVRGRERLTIKASPVQVGHMLGHSVWTAPAPTEDDLDVVVPDAARFGDRYRLSVAAVSATLPRAFTTEMGLTAQVERYASPFDAAYAASMLYVPQVDDDDIAALSRPGQRRRFDTSAHAVWAAPQIVELVAANRGSALVLAATTAAGRRYVDALRSAGLGVDILSQWDGESARRVVQRWRDQPSSVLVGTRSMMTGVDAPGETNTLVVIDRVPRSAGNPVDDARVEVIQKRLSTSRWEADNYVYVADAALLLEQAAGRLVRSTSDSGMVAVLDPRLLRNNVFSFKPRPREVYMEALARFERRSAQTSVALEFLHARHREAA